MPFLRQGEKKNALDKSGERVIIIWRKNAGMLE